MYKKKMWYLNVHKIKFLIFLIKLSTVISSKFVLIFIDGRQSKKNKQLVLNLIKFFTSHSARKKVSQIAKKFCR